MTSFHLIYCLVIGGIYIYRLLEPGSECNWWAAWVSQKEMKQRNKEHFHDKIVKVLIGKLKPK